MAYTTIAVIYNPNSTNASKVMAEEFAGKVRKRLPRQKVELHATTHAGHAEELAYLIARKEKNPLIISASGDGGYNEVINGAVKAIKQGRAVTTGLLPAGNANDHHRSLYETDLVELLIKNQTRQIDLLKLTSTAGGQPVERYAHSYIGFGLTAKIGRELNAAKLTFFKEVWLVVRSLVTVRSIRLKINNEVRRFESIICSNINTMSKYLKISAPSSVSDGKFEVTIFRRRNKLQLVLVLLQASFAGVKQDTQLSHYELETLAPTLVQVDGEIITLDSKAKTTISAEKQLLKCVAS